MSDVFPWDFCICCWTCWPCDANTPSDIKPITALVVQLFPALFACCLGRKDKGRPELFFIITLLLVVLVSAILFPSFLSETQTHHHHLLHCFLLAVVSVPLPSTPSFTLPQFSLHALRKNILEMHLTCADPAFLTPCSCSKTYFDFIYSFTHLCIINGSVK